MNLSKLSITIIAATTLTACGGGGGGSSDSGTPAPELPAPVVSSITPTAATSTPVPTSGTTLTTSGNASSSNPVSSVNSNQNPTATTTTTIELSTPAASQEPSAPPVTRTSELTASETFEFTSSYDVSVAVRLAADQDRYLNICNSFIANGSNTQVDYGSCVLQAPLQNGEYFGDLSLTNDINELVVAIWDYSGADPQYFFWNRALNGDIITVN